MSLEQIAEEVGVKNKEQLRAELQTALAAQTSDIDLAVGGALRDVVEVELALRERDQQLLKNLIAQTSWKTATGAALERLASERGLTRQPASQQVWQVRLSKSNRDQTASVEKGARLQVEGSDPPLYFLAKEAARFTHQQAIEVVFEAEFAGALNLRAGVIKEMVSGLKGIERVENTVLLESGRNLESDQSLRTRIEGYYQTLSNNLSQVGWVARAKALSFVRDVQIVANTPKRGDLDFYFTARPGAGIPNAAQVAALKKEMERYALFEEVRVHAAKEKTFDLAVVALLKRESTQALRLETRTLRLELEQYLRSLFAEYTASGGGTRIYHLDYSLNRFVLGSKIIQFLERKGRVVLDLAWNQPKTDTLTDHALLQLGSVAVRLVTTKNAFRGAVQ